MVGVESRPNLDAKQALLKSLCHVSPESSAFLYFSSESISLEFCDLQPLQNVDTNLAWGNPGLLPLGSGRMPWPWPPFFLFFFLLCVYIVVSHQMFTVYALSYSGWSSAHLLVSCQIFQPRGRRAALHLSMRSCRPLHSGRK